MKVVIDTNVLVSGIFWSGPPYTILKAWQMQSFDLALSAEIFEEYKQVANILLRKYPAIDLNYIIDLIARNATFYTPIILPSPISRDPDDDKFVACALAANAKYIISGDDDLLCLKEYFGIRILKPRQFVDQYINKR